MRSSKMLRILQISKSVQGKKNVTKGQVNTFFKKIISMVDINITSKGKPQQDGSGGAIAFKNQISDLPETLRGVLTRMMCTPGPMRD